MAGKMAGRQTKPAEQALQVDTASGLSARHRPQETDGPQLAGLAANNSCRRRPAPLAVQVSGGECNVLALMKAGSDLPTVPTPPIAFACHCPYPLP